MSCCPKVLALLRTDTHINGLLQRWLWPASLLVSSSEGQAIRQSLSSICDSTSTTTTTTTVTSCSSSPRSSHHQLHVQSSDKLLQIPLRGVHCAAEAEQPAEHTSEQADSTAAQCHATGIWTLLHAADSAKQQTPAVLPGFGAVYAVVAAAAADAAATAAAVAQLLQLAQQQAANADVGSQQHPASQCSPLQVSSQQLAGVALPPMQLLQLLHVSCKLQQTPDSLLHLLAHSAVKALPQLEPMQVADVLCLLATCHSSCTPPLKQLPKRAALNTAVRQYLQRNQHALDAPSTVALAAALAKDTYSTSSTTSRSSSSTASSSSSSFTLLSLLMMDHMQKMTAQQLSEVLEACAAAQHYNQAVMDAAVQVAVQLIRQQGFKLLSQQQQETVAASQMLGDNNTAQQQQQQPQCDTPSLRNAASIRLTADETMLQQQQQQRQQQDGFSPESLARLLQACSALRHHSAELLECAAHATLRSRHAMQLPQVVAVVAACAQLNHYNLALFQEACRTAQQAMADDLNQEQQKQQHSNTGRSSLCSSSSSSDGSLASAVTQLAWSCAVVHHLDPAFFRALAGWAGQLQVQQLSQQQLLQWFQVQFCLSDAAVQLPELRCVGLPSQLLLAAHAAWARDLSGQRLTAFHREVHEALQQASPGRRSRLNVALDGPLVVDVALPRKRSLARSDRTAIQLETPDMFAANPPHAALGPTAARWRALQARGWQVLSLRYSDWCRLKSPEDQARYMWHIKEASVTRTPLAPEVVQVVRQQQGSSSSRPPKSLTQQLWRLLVD